MKITFSAFWVEILKIRRSKMFMASIIFFILVSAMMSFVMFVQKYPEVSAKVGMIGDKASLLRFGEPNWQNYFRLLIQGIAGVGLVGTGFVTSWIFGREFSDHTIKDILAIPVPRVYIVFSKIIIVVLWSAILCLAYFISGLAFGFLIGLPGFSAGILSDTSRIYWITSFLLILLCTPVAFLASYTRGYIFPIGFVILTMILANFSGLVGLGPYFPWAVPGLYGNPSGSDNMQLTTVSYIILICTCLTGLFATIAFWRYADQK
jgi:ABC-type transport system involved in multi-copper enzyme maturation permease subunit